MNINLQHICIYIIQYLYAYIDIKYFSIYFNILTQKEIKNSNDISWVLIGYDSSIFKQYNYAGLLPADELKEYLCSCVE